MTVPDTVYYTTTEYNTDVNATMALLEDKVHACSYYVEIAWLGNKNVEEWMQERRKERRQTTVFEFVKVTADQEEIDSGIVCLIKKF